MSDNKQKNGRDAFDHSPFKKQPLAGDNKKTSAPGENRDARRAAGSAGPDRPDRPDRPDAPGGPDKQGRNQYGQGRSWGGGAKPQHERFGPRPDYARPKGRPLQSVPAEASVACEAANSGNVPEVEDSTLIPGVNPVLELLRADPGRVDAVFIRKGRHDKRTDEILDLCRQHGLRFSLVDDVFLAKQLAGQPSAHCQGVLARLYKAGFVELEDLLQETLKAPLPLLLALDQVQDPGNAGALARTLYALGGGGLIVPRHNGVYLGAAAAKASAGALTKLPVAKVVNLAQALDTAEEAGFAIYGAASLPVGQNAGASVEHPSGGSPRRQPFMNVFELKAALPAVLVLGGEESGLRPGIAKRCHALLHIPMLRDFDSLNVAQAGGIAIAAFARIALASSTK